MGNEIMLLISYSLNKVNYFVILLVINLSSFVYLWNTKNNILIYHKKHYLSSNYYRLKNIHGKIILINLDII